MSRIQDIATNNNQNNKSIKNNECDLEGSNVGSWKKKKDALASVLDLERVYFHTLLYGDHRLFCIINLTRDSQDVLNSDLPCSYPNDNTVKDFQTEYMNKLDEFLKTKWVDKVAHAKHIVWLKELMLKYSKITTKMTSELRPFGTTLPYDVQDLILTEQQKIFEQQMKEYVEWHIKPVIEYMEEHAEL